MNIRLKRQNERKETTWLPSSFLLCPGYFLIASMGSIEAARTAGRSPAIPPQSAAKRGRQPPSRQQQRGAEPQRDPRERKTGGSAGCAEQHRFAQKDPPDVAFSCAEGEQNADLVRPLVRGGQHAAEHAEQGNEQRNAADSEEEQRAE